MQLHSRPLWTTVAAVLVAAIGITALAAQGGPGQRRGGPGRGFGGGPGPMGMLQRLDLTDAQREQVRAILDEQRKGDDGPARKMMDLQRQLREAIFADAPDEARIEQLKAAISEAEATVLATRVATELRIAQVLTPEQRKQAREQSPGPPVGRH